MSTSAQATFKERASPHGEPHYRYRISFGKQGPLRYCSHLDLMRVWERVFRRAGIPLVYSQGFNPRPKLQLAAGLPLGYSSTCEILDAWVVDTLQSLDVALASLRSASPQGLTVEAIWLVDLRAPTLQSLTRLASYQAVVSLGKGERAEVQGRLDAMLAQTEIVRERRGKTYDLRPLIQDIEVVSDDPVTLQMVLTSSQEHGTGRPDEVLEALGFDPLSAHITRTAIEFEGVMLPTPVS